MLPSAGRLKYRAGKDYKTSTFGLYLGYLQTNLIVIPSDEVNDFKEFCRQNSGPCPLIFASSAGQTDAPSLAHSDYDVRTDLSTYEEYKDGVKNTEPLPDLADKPWSDMVSCYLGCSYSFYDRLVGAGVVLPPSKNVAMFKTNIPCIPIGRFSCNMVVSMVPIPKLLLDEVVKVTGETEYCHGAPVHIGSPGDIGIAPGLTPDFGEFIAVPKHCVPCFWACGITGTLALAAAQLPACYSHSPGSMFVSDLLSDEVSGTFPGPTYPLPTVVCTNPGLEQYGALSRDVFNKLLEIERITTEDPGNRGIAPLLLPGDLTKACLDLSLRATVVGVLLGFPLFDSAPAEESDGVAGAVYLARALQAIQAQVYFIVDETAAELVSLLSECKNRGFTQDTVPFITIGNITNGLKDLEEGDFTHLIAIERVSPAQNGKYYTMGGRDISSKVGAMGEVFREATASPGVVTVGIGDGGNELGMGKVKDKVVKHVPHGGLIAAAVAADYLVTCGVSNWGGLALAAGLYALRSCPVHDRYRRRARGFHAPPLLNEFLLNSKQDLELHELIARSGFRDGVNKLAGLTVDGLDYYSIHREILLKLSTVAVA